MRSANEEAEATVALAFAATVLVTPLDPWITDAELKEVVTAYGISPAVYDSAIYEILQKRSPERRPRDEKLRPQGLDLMRLQLFGGSKYPAQFSMAAVAQIARAFDKLDRIHGQNNGVTFELLIGECAGPLDRIESALGFLLVHGHVQRVGDRFVRRLAVDGEDYGGNDPDHPEGSKLAKMVEVLGGVVALRSGQAAPTSPPTQRFFLFLKKQGWEAFASWWALSTKELSTVADLAPTAATVLAGSLLEAALVAIAAPAKAAGEWRQKWLDEDPSTWGARDLIKQAELAGTFSATQATLARQLMDLRNRIHAGKFSTAGKPPFVPKFSDAHEAKLARLNLDALLSRILEWPPIAALN